MVLHSNPDYKEYQPLIVTLGISKHLARTQGGFSDTDFKSKKGIVSRVCRHFDAAFRIINIYLAEIAEP